MSERARSMVVESVAGLWALNIKISATESAEEKNCSGCNFSIFYEEFGKNFIWCPMMFKRMSDDSDCDNWAKPPKKISNNFLFFHSRK
jgi:hypothetical protein